MANSIRINNIGELDRAAREFLSLIGDKRLIALHGAMGAGKTTFTAAIVRCLGINDDAVASPTFSLVNEYVSPEGRVVYHFDFYRIERPEEALDIGLYDYLDSGELCIIEWPENIGSLLPEETLHINISEEPAGERIITFL